MKSGTCCAALVLAACSQELAAQSATQQPLSAALEATHAAESEHLSALRRRLDRGASSLTLTKRADGLTQIDLQDHFQSASVLTRDVTGRLTRTCLDDVRQLDAMQETTR